MRATIEPHNHDTIAAIMEQLGTSNPSVAVNFVIHCYRVGTTVQKPLGEPKPQPVSMPAIDDFDDIPDWG
ncbi:hypothetical protein ACN4EG_25230 [Alkalinema pantanalense CENA528]|uniref:hypothetical protein n=1 Tax=Alkalinema pantanalense TaxID=1620705 RepID=UPI003D6EDF60